MAGVEPPSRIDFDADQLNRVVGDKQPINGNGTNQSPCRDQYPGHTHALHKLGKPFEVRCAALDDRREVDDQKSVADGWPASPRTLPSCSSSCSKNAGDTRTTRRSAAIGLG